MRKAIVSVVVVMFLALAAGAAVEDEDRDQLPSEVREAHEQLREALETLREYYKSNWEEPLLDLDAHRVVVKRELGDLKRPRLGVVVTGSEDPAGARILAVTPGGPADEAGLRAGDVIVTVNGREIGSDSPSHALVEVVRELGDGATANVEFARDDSEQVAVVTVREMEVDNEELEKLVQMDIESGELEGLAEPRELRMRILEGLPEHGEWFVPRGWWKLELVSLDRELGEYFGTESGVLVVRGSDDQALPLRGGDVILSIDGRPVKGPTHATRILRSYEPGEKLSIEVMRKGSRQTLEATVPDRKEHSED